MVLAASLDGGGRARGRRPRSGRGGGGARWSAASVRRPRRPFLPRPPFAPAAGGHAAAPRAPGRAPSDWRSRRAPPTAAARSGAPARARPRSRRTSACARRARSWVVPVAVASRWPGRSTPPRSIQRALPVRVADDVPADEVHHAGVGVAQFGAVGTVHRGNDAALQVDEQPAEQVPVVLGDVEVRLAGGHQARAERQRAELRAQRRAEVVRADRQQRREGGEAPGRLVDPHTVIPARSAAGIRWRVLFASDPNRFVSVGSGRQRQPHHVDRRLRLAR